MINKKYLEQALRIRKDFLKTDNELLGLKNDLKKINKKIENTLNDLKEIRDKSDQYKTNEEFQSDVMKCLAEFEDHSKYAEKIYQPLNKKMEDLKKEEQDLYKNLVLEYPNIKEDILINEIQDYVRSKTS